MTRRIFACGGDGWPTDPGHPAIEERMLALLGADAPRVLFLPTASGDSGNLISRFYEFFAPRGCRCDHLAVFRPHPRSVERAIADQDLVYVGGGSTANLLALWSLHGVDAALRAAYARGVAMAGVSAGAICWFRHGLSNSLGRGFAPVDGLGLLPSAFCPHVDGDPGRAPALEAAVAAGRFPAAYGVDDGAALVFADETLTEVVSARDGRGARRVSLRDGVPVWEPALPAV